MLKGAGILAGSKQELRRAVLGMRENMDLAMVEAKSSAITERVLGLATFKEAKNIMVYVSFRKEVQTEELITFAMTGGQRVLVPVCQSNPVSLLASELRNFPGDLTPGTWGILEPGAETLRPKDPRELDVVVVPGVAFDSGGNRLGYGGGYYDQFLPFLRPDATVIALAYELQLFPSLPAEAHDRPVDMVVTETRVIHCLRERKPVSPG